MDEAMGFEINMVWVVIQFAVFVLFVVILVWLARWLMRSRRP